MQNLHTSSFTWCIPAYLLSTRFRDLFLYFDFWLRSITSDYLSRLFSFKNGHNFYQERKEKKKVSKKFNVTLYTYKTSKYMDLSILYMYIQHRMSTCISPPALLCHKLRDWIDKSMRAFQVPNLTGIRKKQKTKTQNSYFLSNFLLVHSRIFRFITWRNWSVSTLLSLFPFHMEHETWISRIGESVTWKFVDNFVVNKFCRLKRIVWCLSTILFFLLLLCWISFFYVFVFACLKNISI